MCFYWSFWHRLQDTLALSTHQVLTNWFDLLTPLINIWSSKYLSNVSKQTFSRWITTKKWLVAQCKLKFNRKRLSVKSVYVRALPWYAQHKLGIEKLVFFLTNCIIRPKKCSCLPWSTFTDLLTGMVKKILPWQHGCKNYAKCFTSNGTFLLCQLCFMI